MRFRDQLRDELKAVVAERARAKAVERQAVRRLGWQPKLLLAGGFAAALVASMVVVNGYDAEPAWSVEKQDNGWVKVHVNRWSDPQGLEDELEKYVANAEVQIAPQGKKCSDDWYKYWGYFKHDLAYYDQIGQAGEAGTFALAFNPQDVPPGTTLVAYHEVGPPPEPIDSPSHQESRAGESKVVKRPGGATDFGMTSLEIAKGNVGPCHLVPDTE